ncbi:diguanylate cyclase domain-containing protein [Pseudomonas oryzae]|uniref:Diguanylate cyclase (GGDEF) domain-containing protein n=1 Tax=Pseudomonas oryzae TaxID=1392877 RepID=A0A1H1PWK8_9PSED|nr:diguanylate cyclase [Pseudomonas oryzae]SDS15503.1 diguanylate cyclase (GGDEF) domain-containing protein [Pseudomonas oryzae]
MTFKVRAYWARLLVVGTLGVMVSLLAYAYCLAMERKLRASEFERFAHVQSQHVQRLLEHSTQLLHAYRGFFHASGTVDRQQFERFSRAVLGSYPEAFAIHWAARVAEPERAAFEREIEHFQEVPLGIFDVDADAREPMPAPSRGVYYPIRFSEPLALNHKVIGLDTLERPYNQDVTRESARLGDQRVTSVFPLMQDPDGPLAVAVYQPVYRPGAPLVSPVQRWEALEGYLVLMLRPSLLLGEMSFRDTRIDVRLYEMQGDREVAIYPRGAIPQAPSEGVFHHVLEVPGRQWVVEFVAGEEGIAAMSSLQPLLLMLALLALTAVLLVYLDRSHRSAVALARANDELVVRQRELDGLAYYDNLTGLPNRLLLCERLAQALEAWRWQSGELAVCVMDLDGFKDVNDRFGHQAGDEVLQVVARRIQGVLRSSDTVARLGGDEFVVLLGGAERDIALDEVMARLIESIARPIELGEGGRVVVVTASIGVALADPRSSVDSLIREADSAMYEAKGSGKGRYRLHARALVSRPALVESVSD